MRHVTDQSTDTSLPVRSVNRTTANGIRQLVKLAAKSYPGLPMCDLVRTCVELRELPLLIDVEAARMIGVPVVVLWESSRSAIQPVFDKLSARERDVAKLVTAGLDNAAISRRLRISVGTVKDHVHSALRKTGFKSRTELAAALAREGV